MEFDDQHGFVKFITINRDANIKSVRQRKSKTLDKELRYVPLPVVISQITDIVEADIAKTRQSCGTASH